VARRVALIVNARARGLGGGERRALSRGAAAGVTVVETTSLDHARAEIRRLVPTGLDVLGLAGGDGTVVMGLTLLAEACRGAGVAEPAVAVVPLGTGNAFARALRDLDPGLARALPARLAQLIDPARTPVAVRTLSVLGVRTPFCGFGIDAQLLEDQRDVSAAIDRIPLVRGVLGPRARYAASVALRSAPLWMLSDRPEVTLRNLGTPAREVRGADAALVREGPGRRGDVERAVYAGRVRHHPVLRVRPAHVHLRQQRRRPLPGPRQRRRRAGDPAPRPGRLPRPVLHRPDPRLPGRPHRDRAQRPGRVRGRRRAAGASPAGRGRAGRPDPHALAGR
jgi:hypothetical protein